MEMANLKKLCKIAKQNNVPIFGTSEQLAGLDFMNGYLADFAKFDRNTAVNVGFLEPIWNRNEEDSDEAVLSQFQEDASIVLFKNKKNLERLYELTLIDYKPLENYDRHEDKENTMSGGHETERQGSVSETMSGGHTTERQGSVSETMSGGHETERQGRVSETTTPFSSIENETKVYPYDSITASPSEIKTETTKGTMKVETERNGDKDITTFNDEKKVTSHGGDKVITTFNDEKKVTSREGDKDVFNYNNEKSHELVHAHGNIGVTSSQQMAQSEIDLWSSFKFFDIIVNIIVKELCTYRDEQEPKFYL